MLPLITQGPCEMGFCCTFLANEEQTRELGEMKEFSQLDTANKTKLSLSQVSWAPELLFEPWEKNRGLFLLLKSPLGGPAEWCNG